MVLSKTTTLFERDGEGELVVQKIKLVVDEKNPEQLALKDEEIHMIPLTRGEIRKLFAELEMLGKDSDRDTDGELILKHCKNPVYTKKEIKHVKGLYATVIVNTILFHSGLDVLGKTRRQAMKEKEDEFGKN